MFGFIKRLFVPEYTVVSPVKYEIEFLDPNKCLPFEGHSKLLHPESNLFGHVRELQASLRSHGFQFEERIPPHIELIEFSRDYQPDLKILMERALEMQGKWTENYTFVGRAFSIRVPDVSGYSKVPHITVAYFRDWDDFSREGLQKIVDAAEFPADK